MSGFFNTNKLNKRVDRLELLLNSTPETPSPSWGNIEGDIQDQTDLQTALNEKGTLRTMNQWMGLNIYTGDTQFHDDVYLMNRTGLIFDPSSTSTTKGAYAQIAYNTSAKHFKFKVNGVTSSTFWGNLDFSSLTSDQTFTFPNKSGTIALLDDVPNPADFATSAQGSLADSAVQPADLGTAASANVGDFATAAQGTLAGTAIQPADNVSTLNNDAGYITGTTGFGLSTNGSGELQLGEDLLLPGIFASEVNVPDVGVLIFGDLTNSNYPRIAIDNNSENDGYRSVDLRVGEDSVDSIHAQISASNNAAGEYVKIIGQNNDPLVNTHHSIDISDGGIQLEAWSQLTSNVASIRIEPEGTTFSNSVHVPTPTAGSHAATKAYVDANVGGFSGSFVTATDTITVVNGLITAVTPL